MDFLKRIFFTLITIIIFLYVVSTIASFFQISISSYGNYALFICVLILFYSILPNKSSNIF
mgnify:CR=1 FL=1